MIENNKAIGILNLLKKGINSPTPSSKPTKIDIKDVMGKKIKKFMECPHCRGWGHLLTQKTLKYPFCKGNRLNSTANTSANNF